MKTRRDFGPVLAPRHRFMVANLLISAFLMAGVGIYLNRLSLAQEAGTSVVILYVNGKRSDITVNASTTVTLSWTVNGNYFPNREYSCTASGNWSGGKHNTSGSQQINVGSSSGTRTYILTCRAEDSRYSYSDTRKVTVKAAAPAPYAYPTPSYAYPTPPPQPTPYAYPTPTATPAPITRATNPKADKTAPTMPTGLTAQGQDGIIILTWVASTDNRKLGGYRIERSLDQNQWQVLAEKHHKPSYRDTSASLDASYYYRIQAIDSAGNKSNYAALFFNTPITTLETPPPVEPPPWYRRLDLPLSLPFVLSGLFLIMATGVYLFFRHRHQANIRFQQYIKEQYFNDYGMRTRLE